MQMHAYEMASVPGLRTAGMREFSFVEVRGNAMIRLGDSLQAVVIEKHSF